MPTTGSILNYSHFVHTVQTRRLQMKDGATFSYGTEFNFEFFDLPTGYPHSDIAKIHSGMIYSKARGLETYSLAASKEVQTLREKPLFICYLAALTANSR